MRLLIQRVSHAEVTIDGKPFSKSGLGLLVLFGTKVGDTSECCKQLADKMLNLRIFEDEQFKMNLSALDVKAELMIVSQFTLYADTKKGRRPAFTEAMPPAEAEELYNQFVAMAKESGLTVTTGVFGAKMDVSLVNHGPVTIMLEYDVPASQ